MIPVVPADAIWEQVAVYPANENVAVGNEMVWPVGQTEHLAYVPGAELLGMTADAAINIAATIK